MKNIKYFSLFVSLFVTLHFTTGCKQKDILSHYDINEPFGWVTCNSLSTSGDYMLTGGDSGRKIILLSNGGDMRQSIIDAIENYDVIVLDGTNGDFAVSSTMYIENLDGKTIIGRNNARVCTEFFLTEEIHQLLDSANVLSNTSISDGTVYELPNGNKVKELREYVVRKLLIEHLNDPEENYQHSGLFKFNNCSNFIIRNLTFQGPGATDVGADDLMTFTYGTNHMWVDHCDFIDGMDGNFDINSRSDFVTISWCKFCYTDRTYVHANTNLVGSNDNPDFNGIDNLNVTFAYCHWDRGCDQRMPMARFGTIHVLNCYYSCAGNTAAINPRKISEFLIEGCYFDKGVENIFKQTDALAYNFKGNYYVETFEQPEDLGKVSIPYDYNTIPIESVPEEILRFVGATLE